MWAYCRTPLQGRAKVKMFHRGLMSTWNGRGRIPIRPYRVLLIERAGLANGPLFHFGMVNQALQSLEHACESCPGVRV